MKKVGNSDTAIKIVNDILCRGNFSILNKQSNFVLSGNDKKTLHICMQRAWDFWQSNQTNKLYDNAYTEILLASMFCCKHL